MISVCASTAESAAHYLEKEFGDVVTGNLASPLEAHFGQTFAESFCSGFFVRRQAEDLTLMMTLIFVAVHEILKAQDGSAISVNERWLQQMQSEQMARVGRDWKQEQARRQAQLAAIESAIFAEQFNGLVEKLTAFADQYNAGRVDAKVVKSIKQAWLKLQETNGWFRADSPRSGGDRCKH